MTGSLGAAEKERRRQEKGGGGVINNSICCPAWGSISSVSDCQCVWGGEAGAAAHTVLVLTACRAINGHNLISHYHHQWLLACRAQHNSIRQTGVWGWGALLKFKVMWEVWESCEMLEQNNSRMQKSIVENLNFYYLSVQVPNVLTLHDGK